MVKVLLFRVHAGDPLGGAIQDATRTQYTHAALLKDEATNLISEAYFPHVRERVLDNSELHGIDVFEISTTFPNFTPLTPVQVQGILDYCAEAEKVHESYSIKGLIDFIPGLSALIGQVKDDGVTSKVFCSQFDKDAIARGAGLEILKAPGGDLAPGYLPWSPLLFPGKPLSILPNQAPTITPKAFFASEVTKAAEEVAGAVAGLENKTKTTP
jgi:hypothetical protein